MSDAPGNNSHPRDNRGGGRPRNNNQSRRPRRDERRDGPPRDQRRDDRRPRRRDDRRDSRPERKAPAPPRRTLIQRLIAIFTFGLVRPKASAAPGHPARPEQTPRPPRETKQRTPVPPADPESVDSERLHIGNLHYDASETDLLDLFKGVGPVKEVDIVYNGRTHRSKGFGFVQMATLKDARRAVTDLHGQLFMGRPLILGPARNRGEDKREADEE